MQAKKKINWTSSKLKICATKNTIEKVKRQPKEWEKISTILVSDKALVSYTHTHIHKTPKIVKEN